MAGIRNVKGSGGPDTILDLGQLTPKQKQFFKSRALFTAYGGARGGGKTHAVRVKAVGGAVRYPGIRILIVRRTYPELQANHIEQIVRLVPAAVGTYNATNRALYLKTGQSSNSAIMPAPLPKRNTRVRSTTGSSWTRPRNSPNGTFASSAAFYAACAISRNGSI